MAEEIFIDTDDLQRRMNGALSSMKGEFASLRTGRASSSMLDPITVEVYGPVSYTHLTLPTICSV